MPPEKPAFPAVLLIPGSGAHDRVVNLLGHKVFLVLADYLTRKGIAVLRFDDRGVGKSTGDRTNATTADFATDAEAGVAYLKTRSEVGLRTRSGWSATARAGASLPWWPPAIPDVAFIVMVAAHGRTGLRAPARTGAADCRSLWC